MLFFFAIQDNVCWAENKRALVTTVPLEFSQGLASTYITIDNKTIPIILDSGDAKHLISLTTSALRDLHVHYTGQSKLVTSLYGQRKEREFIIPTVQVGNFVLHNVPGLELPTLTLGHDKGFIYTPGARHGLLGLAFLKQFNVLIDYPQHQITYLPQQTYPQNLNLSACHAIKTDFVYGMTADYMINNKPAKLVIDTGASDNFIKPGFAKALPCDEEHAKEIKNCHVNKLRLFADQQPADFYEQANTLPFDGFIGAPYVHNHKVFLDSLKNTFYIC